MKIKKYIFFTYILCFCLGSYAEIGDTKTEAEIDREGQLINFDDFAEQRAYNLALIIEPRNPILIKAVGIGITSINIHDYINNIRPEFKKEYIPHLSLRSIAPLIPPIEIPNEISIYEQELAQYDYRDFFSIYFITNIIGNLKKNFSEKDFFDLIDYATIDPEKLTWLTRVFLCYELRIIKEETPLYRSLVSYYLSSAIPQQELTSEEKFDIEFNKFTKKLNFATYAAQKLYQDYPEKFTQEKNPELGQNNLYNIFKFLMQPAQNNPAFNPYTLSQVIIIRNAFFQIAQEDRLEHFKRYHLWKIIYLSGILGTLGGIMTYLYKKNKLPIFLQEFFDRQVNKMHNK